MEFKQYLTDGLAYKKSDNLLDKMNQYISPEVPVVKKREGPIVITKSNKVEEKVITKKTPSKNKIRIIILTEQIEKTETSYTAKKFKQEGKKLGHNVYTVFMDGAYITTDNGITTIHNSDDKKGFVVSSEDTVAIVRGSVTKKDGWMDLLSQIEKANICCVNSRSTIGVCADKYRTYIRLTDYGLKQPKTMLIPTAESALTVVEHLDVTYPVIIKTLRGSKGIGVLFVESERSLESIIQLIFKSDDIELLMQEYIKTEFDVRVLVLGGQILAAMKRDVIEGDFRSNYSRGGKVSDFKLTKMEVEQCILAAKAVNGIYVGVDFIPGKNRDKDLPYFLEVNSSPGTEGIEEASGDNIIKTVIQHFEDPKHRFSVPVECGYKEVINIEPFGNIVAKFDTGNSGYNVLHAEDIKYNDTSVTWTSFDNKMTSKIVDRINIQVGDIVDERFLVTFDVTFLGVVYKDVRFALDDRDGKSTTILLCKDFMSRLNVMVNPRRKFIVTTAYSVKGQNEN